MTRSRGTARSVRLLLTLLLLTAFGYAPTLATAVPAAPAPDTGILALTSVSPTVSGPGVPVTFTGTVTARTKELTAPAVRVILGATSMTTRAQVASWAAGTTVPGGQEVGSVAIGSPVAAGASAPFILTVAPGRISSTRPFGVIPVAVQVRDSASATSEVLHTFVGWQRTKEYEPMRLAVIAPVTLPPDAALFDADATTRVAAWRRQLDPSGRLTRMLDGTDVDGPNGPVPITWAVDPSVLGPNLTTSNSDPLASVVTALQTRLATGAGRHTLWALPVADADLAATVAADPADPTVRREVQAGTNLGNLLGVPVTTGVAWPVDGSFQPPRESGLAQAYQGTGLTAVVGSSSALPVNSGYTGQAPRRSPSGVPLLAWDDVLSRLITQTTTPAEGALTTQRLVAETATMVGESAGITRSFLLAIPRTTDPDPGALRQALAGLAQTPWVQLIPTDELQQQAATQDPVASMSPGSWDLAGPPQADAAQLARITKEREMVNEVATVLGDNGAAFRAQWSGVLDQLVSARWRADPAGLTRLETSVTQAAASATSGITVAEQTTNFLADEGTLQVVVVNDLNVPVDGVRLVLQPTNPRLRIVDQPDPVRIEAASRAVVAVRAQALAAGLVPVTATVTTADGTPIGVPGTITVRANPPGYSFYIVGGGILLLILVVGLVRTLRRPRRPAVAVGAPPASAGPAPSLPEALAPDDPTVAEASGSTGTDATARRMSDDRS